MSKNCINCVKNERTGLDLLCDECRNGTRCTCGEPNSKPPCSFCVGNPPVETDSNVLLPYVLKEANTLLTDFLSLTEGMLSQQQYQRALNCIQKLSLLSA